MEPSPQTAPDVRVAMLAPGEVFGGAERQILYLLRYFKDKRLSCHLLCFYDRDLAQHARQLGIPTRVLAARPLLNWRNSAAIAKLLNEHDIGVLHVHGYKAAAHALLARVNARFRLVKTEHGRLEFPHQSFFPNLKPRLFRFVENMATRILRGHIVYVTRELQASFVGEHRGVASTVIPNGIDWYLGDQPRPHELARGSWNAVVVGRLEAVKGIEFAIRAFARPGVPDNARLWVVGEGPLRAHLESLSASLLPEGKVNFTGFRRDAIAFIANADALIMPSLHEGLPYTLLESVCAKVPVIASKVGGLAEVLDDGRTALLTASGDVEQLAAAITRLATDRQLAESLAEQAYEQLSSTHSIARMGDAYAKLYASLLSA